MLTDGSSKFVIRAHPSFNKAKDFRIRRYSPHVFTTLWLDGNILYNPKGLSVTRILNPTLMDRYATGAMQTMQFGTEYDGQLLTSEHRVFRHGLTDKGQAVMDWIFGTVSSPFQPFLIDSRLTERTPITGKWSGAAPLQMLDLRMNEQIMTSIK